jgi:soluble lytic murein transglycosylase-like protein
MKIGFDRQLCAGLFALFPLASTVCHAQLAAPEYRLSLPSQFAGALSRPLEQYQADSTYRLAKPDAIEFPVVVPASRPFSDEIASAAQAAGIEPALVHAVIAVESAYRPRAVSPKGAIGLMQIMPETAQRYGISDPSPIHDNLRAGTRHLKALMQLFGNRLDLVLAAYNAGEGAVRKYNNAVPPYKETRDYVPAVLRKYKPLAAELPTALQPLSMREYLPGTRLVAPSSLDGTSDRQ